jgi:hypothetical protein
VKRIIGFMIVLALLIVIPVAASPPMGPYVEGVSLSAVSMDTSIVAFKEALPAVSSTSTKELAVAFKPYYLYATAATLAGLMCFFVANHLLSPKKREYLSRRIARMTYNARDQTAAA